MERLKFEECQKCERWKGYVTDCFEKCIKPFEALEEFNTYKDLEEQGKLLKLPCAVGDTVYVVYSPNSLVSPYTYKEVKMKNLIKIIDYMEKDKFGKTVFLTKSAAEQALKEMEGKSD